MTILSVTISIHAPDNDTDNGLRTYLDIEANQMCHNLKELLKNDKRYSEVVVCEMILRNRNSK